MKIYNAEAITRLTTLFLSSSLLFGAGRGMASPTSLPLTSPSTSTGTEAQIQNFVPDALSIQSSIPLKAGDRVRISVAGFPDLSGDQIILQDGSIQLPMAGHIVIRGLNAQQASAVVANALMPYVRRPQVALNLLSISPIRISISGEILRPGPYNVDPVSVQNASDDLSVDRSHTAITLSDSLILAGGIKRTADLRNITVRRRSLSGQNSEVIRVNLWQAIQQGDLSYDPVLLDGDEIFIPAASLSSVEQYSLLSSTIAPAQISIQVSGEVVNPGVINISPTSTVSQAVAAAGGLTDKAQRNSIELLRLGDDGQLIQQTFVFGEASDPVMNGDLIVVRKNSGDRVIDVLGRLLPFGFLFF